ncbi:unnamed protein product [marine sediment metagenome]|uniref:Uncharacterized protein n=1 Tax=marine sediment metagenome TaxID=412755 RepID=X0US70_9ZZZZ
MSSLREKKRYIVYEVKAEPRLNFKEVKQELEKKMLQFLGELGYGKAGVVILNEWQSNKGMIRTNTKSVENVKTALALVENINDKKVLVRTIGISGMLNKAKNKFFKGG